MRARVCEWGCRYVPMFGEVDYDPLKTYAAVGLEEQLEALGAAVAAGKLRRVGLSNETPWGLMTACHLGTTWRLVIEMIDIRYYR